MTAQDKSCIAYVLRSQSIAAESFNSVSSSIGTIPSELCFVLVLNHQPQPIKQHLIEMLTKYDHISFLIMLKDSCLQISNQCELLAEIWTSFFTWGIGPSCSVFLIFALWLIVRDLCLITSNNATPQADPWLACRCLGYLIRNLLPVVEN